MATLAAQAKTRQPKATPVAEIPATPELDMSLFRAAAGNYKNQFRGRNDEAGTVRARIYIGGDASQLKGEVVTVGQSEVTSIEVDDKGELAKVEYRDVRTEHGVALVILWAPAKATIDGVRLAL